MYRILFFFIFLNNINNSLAQQNNIKDWHLMDAVADGYKGISLKKAYDLLKNRKSNKIIVAVIDSGIDTLHNDIPFWHNPTEIPNNNIDDNKNGLVDDYLGWNYLGAPNGENLSISINDYWRCYHRFKNQFENVDTTLLSIDDKFIYSEWIRAKTHIETKYNEANQNYKTVKENFDYLLIQDKAAQKILHKAVFTLGDILASDTGGNALIIWEKIFDGRKFTNEAYMKEYEAYVKEMEDAIHQKNNAPEDIRGTILKDESYDIEKIHYGNNNLKTHSGNHGTSVSSIIGAIRNNNLGIDGIADNVDIMMVRGILGKDEYDKDVALSIKYAVDNGAKVINMSFGKYISPNKKWVDEAIQYALDHDVVIVHASGNDGQNIDLNYNYPNAYSIEGKRFANFINVSASGDVHTGGIVPFFTNYGLKMVDIFAPGVDINCATTNGGIQYASGTSMASPVVAGIAALLRSYFPHLTAAQVVEIILKSGITINEKVKLPGSSETINFSLLSKTGKIVNAYQAIKLALEMK
jgi:subtilisin family serine protease